MENIPFPTLLVNLVILSETPKMVFFAKLAAPCTRVSDHDRVIQMPGSNQTFAMPMPNSLTMAIMFVLLQADLRHHVCQWG